MSENTNTNEFVEIDNGESETTIRFPLSAELAAELLAQYVQSPMPDISMVDQIHILVSPEAIKRAYDAIPFPPELEKY